MRTGFVLHPGETVHFEGTARDPQGADLNWFVQRGMEFVPIASGESMSYDWLITDSDIADMRSIDFIVRAERDYHRSAAGHDAHCYFSYRVLPL